MNDLEQVIPFSTENGNDYLIKFSKFNNLEHIGISIIDVSLISVNQDIVSNSLKSLLHISGIIKNYLLKHDVILYYYCDTKEINRRDLEILPQKYRSLLFSALFNRYNDGFICKQVVIEDKELGDHHISFITSQSNEKYFKPILLEINSLK